MSPTSAPSCASPRGPPPRLTPRARACMEITGMRADGSIFPVRAGDHPHRRARSTEVTAYLRDITERKAAESELRGSRARIVQAADDARRRLERDLHDGAQQRLTTVALMLRAAQAQLDGAADPAAADAVAQAVDELKAGLAERRTLARG